MIKLIEMLFARNYGKKIILGISEPWSMTRLSQGSSDPGYYIEYCWILTKLKSRPGLTVLIYIL